MAEQTRLAANIRSYRELMNLTQAQLAAQLFVTAQNVSKWEMGKSVPDLHNLCKIADIFGITTDTLLGRTDPVSMGRLLIAVTSSSTKTEFVLFSEGGDVIDYVELGGCNPNGIGAKATQALLKIGLDQLMTSGGAVVGIYAGLAGCSIRNLRINILSFLKKTYPNIRIKLESDIPSIIYSATEEDRCIAVICNTGSTVYAKTPEGITPLGGWSHLWESGCSGYALGRDAIQTAFLAREGNIPQTCLTDLVEDQLGGDVFKMIPEIYRMSPTQIAAFSSAVFAACRKGDAAAEKILDGYTSRLADWIRTAADNGCGDQVFISGRQITANKDVILPSLSGKLSPKLVLHFNDSPQLCGAATGACLMTGIRTPDFRQKFTESYRRFTEAD